MAENRDSETSPQVTSAESLVAEPTSKHADGPLRAQHRAGRRRELQEVQKASVSKWKEGHTREKVEHNIEN